jgi:hypothetical protein
MVVNRFVYVNIRIASGPDWNRLVLDGTQFGDLVNMLNQFDAMRSGPLSTKEAQLALTIVQSERSILVHPLENLRKILTNQGTRGRAWPFCP